MINNTDFRVIGCSALFVCSRQVSSLVHIWLSHQVSSFSQRHIEIEAGPFVVRKLPKEALMYTPQGVSGYK